MRFLYPNIPEIGLPSTFLTGNEYPSNTDELGWLGSQYKRVVSYYSDYDMHNNRRAANQAWSKFNVTNYSYRFNIIPAGTPSFYGIGHFQEVAWVFGNINGIGYAVNPFQDVPERYVEASRLMSRMWSSFVTHLDPNFHGREFSLLLLLLLSFLFFSRFFGCRIGGLCRGRELIRGQFQHKNGQNTQTLSRLISYSMEMLLVLWRRIVGERRVFSI